MDQCCRNSQSQGHFLAHLGICVVNFPLCPIQLIPGLLVIAPKHAVIVLRLASSLPALEHFIKAHSVHRFTLVEQFTLESCVLWFNRSVQ